MARRRTFDFGVEVDYRAALRERYLFAHIRVMEFQPRHGEIARALLFTIFIGDGHEEMVTRLARQDINDLDGTKAASLLADYQKLRKQVARLPWRARHQRPAKRDWLYRGELPTTSTEVLTWGNLLHAFGVDREEFAQIVQRETAPS